jgi:hypothetical protein
MTDSDDELFAVRLDGGQPVLRTRHDARRGGRRDRPRRRGKARPPAGDYRGNAPRFPRRSVRSGAGQQVVRPLQVVCLAAGQEEVERVAQRVDPGVDLGAQSAARASDGLVLTVFFWRRHYADGRARRCCRSSRIRCRRLRRDAETSAPLEQSVNPYGACQQVSRRWLPLPRKSLW